MEDRHEYVRVDSIPQRELQEQLLQENVFKLLFDATIDAVLFLDADLRIVAANRAALQKLSVTTLSAIQGKLCSVLLPAVSQNVLALVRPHDGKNAVVGANEAGANQNVFGSGNSSPGTFLASDQMSNIFPQDTNSFYKIYSYAIRSTSQGQLFANIIRDVSSRRELEGNLGKYTKQLALLHEISKSMYSVMSLNELLKTIMNGIIALGYDEVVLYLLNEDDNQLEGIISTDVAASEVKKISIPVRDDTGVVAQTLMRKKTQYVRDMAQPGNEYTIDAELYVHAQSKSIVLLPLIIEDRILGVLTVAVRDQYLDLDKQDIHLLELFATSVALSINRAELYDQVVTFNKRLKEGIERATKELTEANARLNELDRMKTQLLSIVSHELRTPLTSIKGYTSLLRAEKFGVLTEKQREALDVVVFEADKLKDVVSDVINLSRLVSGQDTLALEVVDLPELIDDVVTALNSQIEEKKVVLEKRYTSPLKIVADIEKVRLCVKHILSNAIKFNREHGSIYIEIIDNDQFTQVDIQDTGIGIPDEQKERIFEDFLQLEEHMTRVGEGIGIGLSVVREAVHLHGGDVWVESVPGVFSRFSFSIPKDIRLPKERKRETELMRALNELDAIRSITSIIHKGMAFTEVLSLIVQNVKETIGFDRVRLYLLKDDGGTMVGTVSVGNPGFEGVELHIAGDVVLEKIFRSRRARITSKYENTVLNERIGLTNFSPFATMPLIIRDKALGVIAADNAVTQRIITRRDLESLTALGNNAAIVISNALTLKVTEQEVEERTRELQEKNKALHDLNKRKDEFLNYVSHELRTPLTSLIGYSKLLLGNKLLSETQIKSSISIIAQESERLKHMIDDFLDLSKMEEGKIEIRKVPSNMFQLVGEVLAIMRPQAEGKNLTLGVVGDHLPGHINLDREKIKQVLLNLVSNAIKFTPSGSVKIRLKDAPDHVQVCVEDTGVGIAQEDFPKLFEKFRQIHHGLENVSKGTGLGLPIAKQLVELQGGKIWLESEKEMGSKFYFTIPK